MSFFGKKYKKVDAENALEIMEQLQVSEKVQALLKRVDNLTSFVKNDDGSIQYIIEAEGIKGMDQRIVLGEEQEFTDPDGKKSKNTTTLEGNVLKSVMKTESGKVIKFTRTFDDSGFKMEIEIEGFPTKAVITYQEA